MTLAPTCQNQEKLTRNRSATDRIGWGDFIGVVDQSSLYQAMSSYKNDYTYRRDKINGDYKFQFSVVCRMYKNESWSVVDQQSQDLLTHEQLHFDNAAFFGRQLLSSLNSFHYSDNYQAEIGSIVNYVAEKQDLFQKTYDAQTNHCKNKVMQVTWALMVSDLLNNCYSLKQAFEKIPAI